MSGKLYIVGSICARGGSKGVPRKNLRLLYGKPLIVHTIECARLCPDLNRVVVSTDDHEIASVARQNGADVPFMRPAHLAQDDSSKWDVFRHLVETLESLNGQRIDVLVDLDTGVPLRQPEDISLCIRMLLESDADVVATAYVPDRNPYFNMVEIDKGGYAIISKPLGAPITCRQDAPDVYGLSPAVYAIRRDVLWNFDHWSLSKMKISLLPRERAVDIDTEVDFRFVEFLMETQDTKKRK
jgi:N-acylneuraminate cytidylyltransferase/CMP-N,N'-diacetyllegionaminic acid synthase